MDQKNTIIGIIIVVLVLIGGVMWWNSTSTPKVVEEQVATTTNTTTTTTTDTDADPVAVARAESAYTQTRVLEKGVYVTIVNLTENGFEPAIIYINKGEAVRFVNKGTDSMRIASNEFQSVPLYAGFGQEKSVGRNATYSFNFTQRGVWGYNNMNGTPKVYGIVYVR